MVGGYPGTGGGVETCGLDGGLSDAQYDGFGLAFEILQWHHPRSMIDEMKAKNHTFSRVTSQKSNDDHACVSILSSSTFPSLPAQPPIT